MQRNRNRRLRSGWLPMRTGSCVSITKTLPSLLIAVMLLTSFAQPASSAELTGQTFSVVGDSGNIAGPSFGAVDQPTSMIGNGTYRVTATREGLVGSMTSSGHTIVANDYFVSLPACTPTNCPGGPYWGQMTNCGASCYVKVTNPATGACRVEPVYDTGPWFRVDDWWNTTADRFLNKRSQNPNKLVQGYTGADAARNGLDVGYGRNGAGIGGSDAYPGGVGNRSAIDLADGTWIALGLPFAQGLVNGLDVQMLWQTGASPAAEASACGHPLNQTPGNDGSMVLSINNGIVGSSTTVNGSGFQSGETVSVYWDSTSGTRLGTVTVGSGGSFAVSVTIPEAVYGNHTVIVRGGTSGKEEQAPFSVRPSLSRVPTAGTVGTNVTVTMRGFGANESVQLDWDNANGQNLGSATTNGNGTATRVITIPNATVGSHDYTGAGARTGARAYGAIYVQPGGSTPTPTSTPSTTVTPTSTATVTPGGGTAVVTGTGGGGLNCRTTPSTSGGVITVLAEGATVQLNGTAQNGWQPVICNGRAGYASATYLKISSTPTPAPTRTPSPTATAPATPTKTPSPTATATKVPTKTATASPTATAIPTKTSTVAPTSTIVPTKTATTAPGGRSATVTGTGGAGVNCRVGPNTSSGVITVLAEGATVQLNGTSQNGWQPVICNGRAGYVSSQFLTIAATPTATTAPTKTPTIAPTKTATLAPTKTATTAPTPTTAPGNGTARVTGTGGGLNCRTAPNLSGTVITVLAEGATVQLRGAAQNGWQPVICSGRTGYVSAQYLTISAPRTAAANAVPAQMAPTEEMPGSSTPDNATTPTAVIDTPTVAASPIESIATPIPTATEALATPSPVRVSPTTALATATREPSLEATLVPTLEPTLEPTLAPTVEPTVEPTLEPTVEPTFEPTLAPTVEPTIEPTAEPVLVTHDQVITVAGDASVNSIAPDQPQAGEQGSTLTAGGPDGATTVLTFNVEGVGAGSVVSARLVLTGSGETAGTGGPLLAAPGVGFDEYGVTQSQINSTGLNSAGWIDYVQPGAETSVDVTGIVTADGTISFVIPGTPEQVIGFGSREGGAPAYLVLTIEEVGSPDTAP